VNYKAVADVYARKISEAGGSVRTDAKFLVLQTRSGRDRRGDHCRTSSRAVCSSTVRVYIRIALRGCAGSNPGVRIVPFGRILRAEAACRVPVQAPDLPGARREAPVLGVHFTRMIGGGVECGPNAVLAFRREGYRLTDASARDMWELAMYRGFWKMSRRFWRVGAARDVPLAEPSCVLARAPKADSRGCRSTTLVPAGAGPCAHRRSRRTANWWNDYFIRQAERMIHVLKRPLAGGHASISIGRSIAEMALKELGLR